MTIWDFRREFIARNVGQIFAAMVARGVPRSVPEGFPRARLEAIEQAARLFDDMADFLGDRPKDTGDTPSMSLPAAMSIVQAANDVIQVYDSGLRGSEMSLAIAKLANALLSREQTGGPAP